jgi:hypothetical protein
MNTLSYELAKELKDAGFFQSGDGYALVLTPGTEDLEEDEQTMRRIPWEEYVYRAPQLNHSGIYEPTLSELIEACEKPIQLIIMDDGGATAMHLIGRGLACTAVSPLEAVARLWLALNKK